MSERERWSYFDGIEELVLLRAVRMLQAADMRGDVRLNDTQVEVVQELRAQLEAEVAANERHAER